MSNECEHGQLARSCNICEYEEEIADLTAKLEKRDKSLEWHQDQMALAQCAQFDAEEKLEKAEAENANLSLANTEARKTIGRLNERLRILDPQQCDGGE